MFEDVIGIYEIDFEFLVGFVSIVLYFNFEIFRIFSILYLFISKLFIF